MKKLLSLILALVLVLSLAACAPADNDETTAGKDETTAGTPDGTTAAGGSEETTEAPYAPLFNKEDNVKISVWASPNSDLEFEGSVADLAIEKTINATVDLYEYPDAQAYDTAMAEKKVPQISYWNGNTKIQTYGESGAYINWYDYLDQLPNVKAMLEDEQWAADVQKFTISEGVMYGLPIVQTGYASVWGYLYRQDIFEKNNLTFPTTQEEFYNTLKTLKGLYPESYPFVLRQMNKNMQGLEAWGYNWGANHELGGYFNTIMDFDHETKTYYFAQTSDTMKEMVAYLAKLTDEGLLHPSSLTLDTQGWTEALATDTSFITYDKVDRIPALTAGAIDANPNYVLTGAAPIAMGSTGVAESKKQGPTNYSYCVSAVQSEEDLNNALAYIDWMYSEEGILVGNWGIEGETYEVVDGNKVWKEGFTYAGSGLGVCGIIGYRDFDAYIAAQDENIATALEIIAPYAVGKHDPTLTYTEEEQAIYDTYKQALYDASLANLQKFILGQLDTETDWDKHVAEMEALHLEDILKVHESAYKRIYG